MKFQKKIYKNIVKVMITGFMKMVSFTNKKIKKEYKK